MPMTMASQRGDCEAGTTHDGESCAIAESAGLTAMTDIYPPTPQREARAHRVQIERVPPKPCFNPKGNTETRYRAIHNGETLGVWRDPECSAARRLVELGLADRADTLETYRGDQRCMTGRIGWFADRRAVEGGGAGTPRFVKWRPPPDWAARCAGSRVKPASDDPADPLEPDSLEEQF